MLRQAPDRHRLRPRPRDGPTSVRGADSTEVRELLQLDKKRDAGGLRMVLLGEVGAPVVRHVDTATVDLALAAVEAPD